MTHVEVTVRVDSDVIKSAYRQPINGSCVACDVVGLKAIFPCFGVVGREETFNAGAVG